MPALSGSPTQQVTSAKSIAELEIGIIDSALEEGDFAFIGPPLNRLLRLQKTSTATPDGSHVFTTQTSQGGTLPGRWVLLGGNGGSAIGVSVVLRPGDPNPAPNVYTTWDSAHDALASETGLRFLEIDNSLIAPAPATITPGTWDMRGIRMLGSFADLNQVALLQALDGAHLRNFSHVTDLLQVFSSGNTSPVVESEPGGEILLVEEGSRIFSTGGVPFFHISAGQFIGCVADKGGIYGDGVNPAFAVDAGGVLLAILIDQGETATGSVSGPAGAILQYNILSTSALLNLPQPIGLTSVTLATFAELLGYTPAVPAEWVAPPPDNAKSAIDRVAALLFANFGPIP